MLISNLIKWHEIQKNTLVENCVYGRKLQGEHGLSLYVEVGDNVVLFDTGVSDLFARNARFLHCDLEKVDYLVLSHRHSDHAGGLEAFLDINKKAKVVCKSETLAPKFKGDRENGIKHSERLDMSRFMFVDKTTEILPGVCHCSGVDKYALFHSICGDKVFYNHTGCVKEIDL